MNDAKFIARAIAASHIQGSTDDQLITMTAGDLVRMLAESYERATDKNPTWGIYTNTEQQFRNTYLPDYDPTTGIPYGENT